MSRSKEMRTRWAILSDHYGVWFPNVRREWYGDDVGNPGRITDERLAWLIANFDEVLGGYDEIVFYHHPHYFHSVYKQLLRRTVLRDRVRLIKHLNEIV